ncbi:TetR/AcrR family transcriptional regulator [Bacillus mesophilum]|uniref:TetR/AcrR family transcriptional regulator n=1 Tax=Bacillus mesophilum TaxID=1071718 RepID=A0A7V7RQH5_9BACI|nr:TetR/AcrR family transcriptional regulator [Bacillus mesophilum]KAB2335689.1 TetR/AcrR family transcriptional regulator [Bacillus mesophilum]
MPKGFTDQEKINIKKKLISACQYHWTKFGYRKTNVEELCRSSGISKGAFYLFFENKESLFFETLLEVQNDLYGNVEEILLKDQNKYGVAKAMKKIYRVYDTSPYMYDTSSADFLSFYNKLSEQQQKEINLLSYHGAKEMLQKSYLTLKVSEELALSVLSTTLLTISLKDKMLSSTLEVFDFIIDSLVEEIFE